VLGAVVAFPVFIGWGEAQSPKPAPAPSEGPVQGYHGGYDPADKSKAPAAPDGNKTDAGNPDEGRHERTASGTITARAGRTLTLDNGLVLEVPPTLTVDRSALTVGTRITARYTHQGRALVVTSIERVPS
jgi:hypothetical protein